MSRKERVDLFLSKFISRKLLVWIVATVALFTNSLESSDWVTVATVYISLQGVTDIVERLYKAKSGT